MKVIIIYMCMFFFLFCFLFFFFLFFCFFFVPFFSCAVVFVVLKTTKPIFESKYPNSPPVHSKPKQNCGKTIVKPF